MRKVDLIIPKVEDEIGRDSYVIYPDSHRLIPEAVVWGFASGCVLEFAKGFFDFKGMGERSRKLLDELHTRWKTKQGFEEFAKIEGLDVAMDEFLEQLPGKIDDSVRARAIDDLDNALQALGMRKADAQKHAMQIAIILEEHEQ